MSGGGVRGVLSGRGSVRDLGRRSGGLRVKWACGELFQMLYVLLTYVSYQNPLILHIFLVSRLSDLSATISKASGVGTSDEAAGQA